ncbi:helix-turn-helix domain-containing protein [Desulfofundulus thermobenzoicus]|uniref:Helix-turn-helix domain-containing protein n=1 Tax=Desulfofundulus thermobenzoicus TaxID=29376 RepID=A0A6N7IQZ1_9FIRM|nr:helix-turn-helix domain-containing protein [Desulfofundulus thermobenzoicus]
MGKKPRLRELIALAKNGNEEAMTQVVQRFIPIVKKYGRRLGYEDACSDLVTWIVEAVYRYRPNTTWGRDELNRYFSRNGGDRH